MSRFRKAPKDDAELAYVLAYDAFWDVHYHEGELTKAHKVLAIAKAMMARVSGVTFTVEDAFKFHNDSDEEGDDKASWSPIDWFRYQIGQEAWEVDYHETELKEAHAVLGTVKALLLRTTYNINLDEVEQAVKAKLKGE